MVPLGKTSVYRQTDWATCRTKPNLIILYLLLNFLPIIAYFNFLILLNCKFLAKINTNLPLDHINIIQIINKNTFKVVRSMSYSLQTPPLPKVPLSQCADEERKIQGKCWDLKAVQKDLQANKLQILLTTKAVAEASKELRWSQVDFLNFFLCLETRHYQSSQWCLPPKDGQFSGEFAADAYLMGFDRLKKVENSNRQPHVYLKFAVLKTTVLIFSFHPSIY